jgi:hypothetical protein
MIVGDANKQVGGARAPNPPPGGETRALNKQRLGEDTKELCPQDNKTISHAPLTCCKCSPRVRKYYVRSVSQWDAALVGVKSSVRQKTGRDVTAPSGALR